MSTRFSKTDKPKGKFAQSNINLVYRGNATEIQTKPTLRSGGMQLVGKLQGTRRNPPPPPWVPSIKAEMGGHDTRVNIVPPGGSGWGTNSSTSATADAASKNDLKSKPSSPSVLKDITDVDEKDNDESKQTLCSEPPMALVKPPQKPFFALRSSKTIPTKSSTDGSPDIGRSLGGKPTGPTIPFYQRPTTTQSSNPIPPKESDIVEVDSDEKPVESKNISADITTRSGWAAVTSEEPNFQDHINFSDDEEIPGGSAIEVTDEPKKTEATESSWVSPPIQSQMSAQVPYPRSAWDQPTCFNPVPPIQHSFNAPFRCPNDVLFPDSPIPGAHVDVLPSREVTLISEQLHRATFSTSDSQAQAQREERTLAYKNAVTKAQMARKKRDVEAVENNRKDHSLDPTKSTLNDVNVFSQSTVQSGSTPISGPPAFLHGPVNHSPQHHNVEPMIAALYNNGLSNLMHSVAPGNGHLPSQMKPQAHLTSSLSPPSWNPSSYSTNNQPPFMQTSYPLSNSPKLSNNQGFYFKSDTFTMAAFNQQPNSKSGHLQGLHIDGPSESSMSPYTNTMEESPLINPLSFATGQVNVTKQSTTSPVTVKGIESESNKELLTSLPRTAVISNHPNQIPAHPDSSNTAFTPSSQSTIENFQSQSVPQHPHITPLMEVDLTGKWSDKDFAAFPASVPSRGNYPKSYKPGSGGGPKHCNDDKSAVHRYATFSSSSGRQHRAPPRDAMRRSARRPAEGDEEAVDGQPLDEAIVSDGVEGQQSGSRRKRRDEMNNDTFPRRVRGLNRVVRPNRSILDCEDGKQASAEFDRQQCGPSYNQRDKWKIGNSAFKIGKQGDKLSGDGGVEKAASITSGGSSRGRKNFSRSGPGTRRYGGNEEISKSRNYFQNHRKNEENPEGANATSQNDADNVENNILSESEQATTNPQTSGMDSQQHHLQRLHRGGGNNGRTRRGQHSSSQRQLQRRDRIDRPNMKRLNNRRHPDEDDDHDFKGGSSNGNVASTTPTAPSTGEGNSRKGESGANTEPNSRTTTGGQQQQCKVVDSVVTHGNSISIPSTKTRSHAHSVTLASDVEVWETASEGFNSSLFGTSPCCSFTASNASPSVAGTSKTDDHRELTDDEAGYSHSKRFAQRRVAPKITGTIVPLMSINAEAPPSYCDDPSFLDSPPPIVKSFVNDTSPPIESRVEAKDIESMAESGSSSSKDGFMEVRSKSSKKQQRAKQLHKGQKSSVSSEDRSSGTKSKSCDPAKLRSHSSTSPKSDHKSCSPSKADETSVKDKQHSNTLPLSTMSSQTSTKHSESMVKKLSNPPVNAWLKPLQETINEKAAKAAAAAATISTTQSSTKSKVPTNDQIVSLTKASLPTTASSSYAWSVVVGSRSTPTATTSCTSSENAPVTLIGKTGDKSSTSKSLQNTTLDRQSTSPFTGSPHSNAPVTSDSATIPQTRQSKSSDKPSPSVTQDEGATQLPQPSRVSTAISSTSGTATSANVCKVRPQKQPSSNLTSGSAVSSHSSKSESAFSVTTSTTSILGSTALVNSTQYRRPVGELGDWFGKPSGVYPSNSSIFFNGYGSKKMDTTPDTSLGLNPAAVTAAAIYMHHQQQQQQQPFRQTIQPLQQQQPMMGFGLPDLTMRHQSNRINAGCSQNGMGADNYFTAPPFGSGSVSQAGAQQPTPRSLYPPVPPAQRGFPSWQPQQSLSHQESAAMAAVANAVGPQAATLWSSNYTPPPAHHHHPPYVGVIGADRPSSTSSVSMTSRFQSDNACASIYGSGSMRSGTGTTPGAGGAPFAQPPPPQAAPLPPPSGLYASSPTHPTPPPPLPFDPSFAYTSGGLPNSTSVFSHQSGAAGGPALLAAPHRQSGPTRSLGEHPHTPHPPVFINASHGPFPGAPAAISVHGLPGHPAASITTPGLHF